MEEDIEQSRRMAALCKRLGHLWTGRKVAFLDEVVTDEKLMKCERTILGKLYGSPIINFQAFQATMKKAWKMDNVVCKHIELGLFSFEFDSLEDKMKVISLGPWSFSGYLLVLQPWIPGTPPHCLKFEVCQFWMQIHGLPIEGRTEAAIKNIAENVGQVLEVRMEAKGAAAIVVGKARVQLTLALPLLSGMTASIRGKEYWLDFRYERLPRYCYSCGKIGHYAQFCEMKPNDDNHFTDNGKNLYGSWMRAEANEQSPFWNAFYAENGTESREEEILPETPDTSGQLTVIQNDTTRTQVEMSSSMADRGKRKVDEKVGDENQHHQDLGMETQALLVSPQKIVTLAGYNLQDKPQKKQRRLR